MVECFAYHVVTDRPMELGQRIFFDESHHSGVYQRVMERLPLVREIYAHPQQVEVTDLDHHTLVAMRELALEEVRARSYADLPSRLGCLYVSDTLEEAEKWAELFLAWGRPVFSIVRLHIVGAVFAGDANNCFDAVPDEAENLLLAERYWQNLPNLQGEDPIRELLVNGTIEVVELVKEWNAAL